MTLGTLIGAVAGFAGGWLDRVIVVINDILLAFPGFLLALAIVAARGSSLESVITAVSIAFTPRVAAVITEVSEADGVAGSVARTATQGHRKDGSVSLGPQDEVETDGDGEERPDLVVVAGGNLGLIYFNAIDERLTLEQIEQLYPDSDPGACGPPRHRHRHRPVGGARPPLPEQGRHPLPR